MGELYLCGTPIGNLEDITFRAVRILKKVDLIAAEDTRQTKKLCNHYEITTPLTSYHEHNKDTKGEQLIEQLLEGKNIAVVSDAGMPGISDPGSDLVALAIEKGIRVIPVPGAVAGISALVVSGLSTDEFVFIGFLSSSGKKRRQALEKIKKEARTLIFYEGPHRLRKTLQDCLNVLGDRKIVVGRELTKIHEEIWRGTISEALEYFQDPKGEIALIVEGATEEEEIDDSNNMTLVEEIDALLSQGMEKMDCFKKVAKCRKMSKSEVYEAYHKQKSP